MATGYENFNKVELHSLFASDQWNYLDKNQKLNACQEVENRYAAENGVIPCVITDEPMIGKTFGYQYGNSIKLNSHLLEDGVFVTTYNDENMVPHIAIVDVGAPSWNTLDTVYHEGTHGIDSALNQDPSIYISSETDHDLYRIQGCEKKAFAAGQYNTLEAISEVQESNGYLDSAAKDYIDYVKTDSFDAALERASVNYDDPNIENTVNTVINDKENDIFRYETSESYDQISDLIDSQSNANRVDYNKQFVQTQDNNISAEPNMYNNDTSVNNENASLMNDSFTNDSSIDTDSSASITDDPFMNDSSIDTDSSASITDDPFMNDSSIDTDSSASITDDPFTNDSSIDTDSSASITDDPFTNDSSIDTGSSFSNSYSADSSYDSGSDSSISSSGYDSSSYSGVSYE